MGKFTEWAPRGRTDGAGNGIGRNFFEGTVFEDHEFFEEVLFAVVPVNGFFPGAFLGLLEEAADVSEGAGATGGDAIGGEGAEELAEDMVDVDLHEEIAAGGDEIGGEVVFAGLGFSAAGMGEAEAVGFGMGGQPAHTAIGERELTKVVRISCVTHGYTIG